MFRAARHILLIALVFISLFALPLTAGAAAEAAPLEQMLIMVEPMGESSLVSVLSLVDKSVALPATVEFIVPNVFEATSAQLVRSDAFTEDSTVQPAGEVAYDSRKYDDRHTVYSVTIEGADSALMRFVAPAGIFTAVSNGHATAKLTLPLASDVGVVAFQFVLPAGAVPVGDNVGEVGKTEDGKIIAGQAFEDLKAGSEAEAIFALGASVQAADAAVSAEESQTAIQKFFAGDNLIVMALIGAIVIIGAVALALALGRRRAAEALEYEEYDEEEYEGEHQAEGDTEVAEYDEVEDDASEETESEATKPATGDFFRD